MLSPALKGCRNTLITKDETVKIIKTKTYSTKPEFDKIVADKPEYNIGYDKTLGLDFSFSKKHFDKYNNVIYQEDFQLNNKNEEETIRTISYNFYSAKEEKLSSEKLEGKLYGEYNYTEYVRDEKGQLIEIRVQSLNKLQKKTICSYNDSGQRIKEEVYEENGLGETQLFFYDSPSLVKGNLIKLVRTGSINDNWKQEILYEYNKDNKISKQDRKYFEFGKLISDLTTEYYDYSGEIATKKIIESYDAPTTLSDGTIKDSRQYKSVIKISLNDNEDISEYTEEMGGLVTTYKCDYTYNEKN
jgi:hypothetical protein